MNNYLKILHNLVQNPFTSIHVIDKEKFHTGMLKLLLEYCQANKIEHKLFKNNTLHKLECDLETKSVDLLVTQVSYTKEIHITIIEAKFKTGLHVTDYKNKVVSQIQKYAYTHPEASEGIVVSLFKESTDLSIEKHEFIKQFKNITFTNQVLDLINKALKHSNKDSIHVYNLLVIWGNYLKDLKGIVNEFEKQKLNLIAIKNLKYNLQKLRLKGVFQQYRMNLVKEKVDKLINSEKISKGKLGNTHGNAFLHHEITFGKNDFNFEKYGIQWQNGKLKFYIELKNKGNKIERRDSALKEIGTFLHDNFFKENVLPKNVNRNGKFKSFNIAKVEEFSDLNKLPNQMADSLNYLVNNAEIILELTAQN